MLNRANLHPYQNTMVDWLLSHPKAALFAGMGLGKTVATLTAIVDRYQRCDTERVLIVAPLRVAVTTWPAEIAAWEHLNGIDYQVIRGTPKQRASLADTPALIHVINVDMFGWLVKHHRKRWPYDWLILDESTLFKSPSSRRFRALKSVARKLTYYTALSGTPAPNGLLDLWAQVWPIDYGERLLGRTMTAYKDEYFEAGWQGWTWTPRPEAQQRIEQKLNADCLSMAAASHFDLPPEVRTQVLVDMPPKAAAIYQALATDYAAELSSGAEITIANALTLAGKLLQMAAGAIYDDDGQWSDVHAAKLEALDEVIESAAGAPVLVAYQYRHDLERLLRRYKTAAALDKNPDTVRRWNRGEIPILLVHPASAGHGLSLQHGGNVLAFFTCGWSLEHYQQVIERIGPTRQAQSGYDRPVYIHHIITRDTIDETVYRALAAKADVQSALLAALRKKIIAQGAAPAAGIQYYTPTPQQQQRVER